MQNGNEKGSKKLKMTGGREGNREWVTKEGEVERGRVHGERGRESQAYPHIVERLKKLLY